MKIVTQAIRVIDYENNTVLKRDNLSNISEYIGQLISYVSGNVVVRAYKTESAGGEVISAILKIIQHQDDNELINYNIDLIAERLLRKEKEANEKITHLKTNVQKGSLILALIEDGGHTLFLLAKVEHTDFFDDLDYCTKSGFPKDTKKIWKTCLFRVDDVRAERFEAKVYSQTVAKYWWHDFLELKEKQNDENNTKKAYRYIKKILSRSLKKEAPHDYMVIMNTLYQYFNSMEIFDYEEVVNKIIDNYAPYDMTQQKKEQLLNKLEMLPEKENFDWRFNLVPSAINVGKDNTYDVYNGIKLKIPQGMKDIEDLVQSCEDEDGKQYLKIRVNDDDTYRTFKKHNGSI